MKKFIFFIVAIFCSSVYAANYIVYNNASYDSKPIAHITLLNQKEYVSFYKGNAGWNKVANVKNGMTGWINLSLPNVANIHQSMKLDILNKPILYKSNNIYSKADFINQYQQFISYYKVTDISPYSYEYIGKKYTLQR